MCARRVRGARRSRRGRCAMAKARGGDGLFSMPRKRDLPVHRLLRATAALREQRRASMSQARRLVRDAHSGSFDTPSDRLHADAWIVFVSAYADRFWADPSKTD